MASSKRASDDKPKQELYLLVTEERKDGYFHLRGRFVTQQYEGSGWVPQGVDDDYADGLLWSGLRVSCQGDERSQRRAAEAGEQGPVYGWDTEYVGDYHRLDLRRCRRMVKTLDKLDKGLAKITEARGYARSFGEDAGRVAEVFGCKGFGFDKTRAGTVDLYGQRWIWTTVGDGVNRVNHQVFLWADEARPKPAAEEQAS